MQKKKNSIINLSQKASNQHRNLQNTDLFLETEPKQTAQKSFNRTKSVNRE